MRDQQLVFKGVNNETRGGDDFRKQFSLFATSRYLSFSYFRAVPSSKIRQIHQKKLE